MSRLACPGCGRDDGFWREVEVVGYAWQQLDAELLPDGGPHDIEWQRTDPISSREPITCTCGWKGQRDDITRLGWDGEPLPVKIRGQLEIEAA